MAASCKTRHGGAQKVAAILKSGIAQAWRLLGETRAQPPTASSFVISRDTFSIWATFFEFTDTSRAALKPFDSIRSERNGTLVPGDGCYS